MSCFFCKMSILSILDKHCSASAAWHDQLFLWYDWLLLLYTDVVLRSSRFKYWSMGRRCFCLFLFLGRWWRSMFFWTGFLFFATIFTIYDAWRKWAWAGFGYYREIFNVMYLQMGTRWALDGYGMTLLVANSFVLINTAWKISWNIFTTGMFQSYNLENTSTSSRQSQKNRFCLRCA